MRADVALEPRRRGHATRWSWARFAHILMVCVGFGLAAGSAGAQPADVIDGRSSIVRIASASDLPYTKAISLGVGKAIIFELPIDAQDAVISDPKTLDAAVLTARRVMLFAKAPGVSNVFVMGRDGRRLLILDVAVKRDMTELARMLQSLIPGSRIRVSASGEGVVLTGSVAQPADSARAADIAAQFIGAANRVVNMLTAGSKEQIMLKVTVAELQRDALRRMGVNVPEALLRAGSFSFTKVMANNFPVSALSAPGALFTGNGQVPFATSGSALQASTSGSGGSISAMLEAFERVGLSRTLAEPTLVAISGESAKFHAGGELPVPVAQENQTISVVWKPFGVSVAFTPYVLSEGRISLKVAAEVSELSSTGALATQAISIPAVQVRRAETVVEMPSGSALAMAGLLSDQTRRNTDGVPELKSLPVLGSLFSSKDFKSSQSELVIIVTPYIVRPTEPGLLSRPDEGLLQPSPLHSAFRGHLHRIYSQAPQDLVRGAGGYIVEHPGPGVKD
jgi:pilus assembly protein CpaC